MADSSTGKRHGKHRAQFASLWSELSGDKQVQAPALLAFYRWWDSLRRGRDMPLTRDFLPSNLGFAADWAYALRRERDGHLQVTHLGVALDALFSQEIMEGNYLERLRESDAALLEEHVDQILSLRCGGYLERRVVALDGRVVHLRTLELPLVSEDGCVRHLCGMAEMAGDDASLHDGDSAAASRYVNFQYFDLKQEPSLDVWLG